MAFLKEFKEFALKGNVMDMAVGVVVGGAFTAIVTSLTGDVVQPLVDFVTGTTEEGIPNLQFTVPGTTITFGFSNFISAVIQFFITAVVVFAVVKAFNKAQNLGGDLSKGLISKVAGKDGEEVVRLIQETGRKSIGIDVNLAKEEGATIACGGEPYTDGACANGSFMKPTLIVNATNDMRVAQEEIFGPVAVVIKFKTEEEVIAMANDSVYGLGGAVWTRDINRAIRVARGVETGRMWVNTYNQIPSGAPFGGYKQSGIGRETHKVILEHYTQQKNIMINLNETPSGFYPEK